MENGSVNRAGCWRLVVAVLLGFSWQGVLADIQPVVYSPHAAHFSVHMNMGPTGAAAWMRGYHFQIVAIAEGSPADGILEFGDLVIGANGVRFGAEAGYRIPLGLAIGEAEATGEPLALQVVRGDEELLVEIPLPQMGPFAVGWPYDCKKSARIVEAASRVVMDAQQPNGRIATSGNMGTTMGALLLLATGEPAYMDSVRRAAYHTASVEYPGMALNNWAMGYAGILLAEYYLATGDDTVLDTLTVIADELAFGQMKSGTWGHKSPGAGYGNLNQPGVTAAIALVLAQECGIDVDPDTVERALDFYSRFAQTGNIPYGDHMPGEAPDNNGTSASAAVLMHLAGRNEDAQAFARSVALHYWGREHGHTGGFWSKAWGPLAAALVGQDALETFMAEQAWYYNLSRTWQGGFVLLPYQEALTRFDGSNYIDSGPDFTTGGMALGFALPDKRLRILGAEPSVFSTRAVLSERVRDLRDLYLARAWDDFDAAMAAMDKTDWETDADRRGVAQLQAARSNQRASVDHTIMEIESYIDEQHGFLALQQFEALQHMLGEEGDDRFEGLSERFADGGVSWNVDEGKRFWEAWEELKNISNMNWTAPGQRARDLLEPMPSLRPPVWERLAAPEAYGPQPWRSMILASADELPADWAQLDFDDADWVAGDRILLAGNEGLEDADRDGIVAARRRFDVSDAAGEGLRVRVRTVRPAETRIYLNGQLVVDVVRGQRGSYAFLELDDAAMGALLPEGNVLAVMSTAQGGGGNRLDVGLDITRHIPQRQHLRIDRVPTVRPIAFAALDDTLRVREASDQGQAAFRARYDDKPLDALLASLADPVAYIRHIAGNAIVDRGPEAIEAVLSMADHADWRVRSTVAHIIQKSGRYRREPDGHESFAVLLEEQVPVLVRLLEDEHPWVRVRASIALRTYGEQAAEAIPALQELVDDEDDWVRLNAIRGLQRITSDPEKLLPAALAALHHTYSGFSAPRAAFNILAAHPQQDIVSPDEKLPAWLHVLRHPPEGDGRFLLNQVMDRAKDLDPTGERLIPVLIEAASDATHLSRIRQDPRGHAIRMLADYGEKAADAVPVLEEILDTEEDRQWHDDARAALEAIQGAVR